MKTQSISCGKNCRNTCSMLNEALRKETVSVQFYEEVLDQCNSPEIRNLIVEMIDQRRAEILSIIQKLNEIHARSQSIDGVISSFQ